MQKSLVRVLDLQWHQRARDHRTVNYILPYTTPIYHSSFDLFAIILINSPHVTPILQNLGFLGGFLESRDRFRTA